MASNCLNSLGLSYITSNFSNGSPSVPCSFTSSVFESSAPRRDGAATNVSQEMDDWYDFMDVDGYEREGSNDGLLDDGYGCQRSDDGLLDVEYECEGSGEEEEMHSLLERIDEEDEDTISPILQGFPVRPTQSSFDHHTEANHPSVRQNIDHPNNQAESDTSVPPPYFEHPIRLAVPRDLFPGGIQELEDGIKIYLELRDNYYLDSSSLYSASNGQPETPLAHTREVLSPFLDGHFIEEPRRKPWSWKGVKGKMGLGGKGRLRSFFGQRRGRVADSLLELARQVELD